MPELPTLPTLPETQTTDRLIVLAVEIAKNCPCGELMADCSYPYCGLGGETLAKVKCDDCPTPDDCSRYGCQWGD